MTPLTQSAIEDAFTSEEALQQTATQIGANIVNGVYDISKFVEHMGFALTSPMLEYRVNGTKLLSDVLQKLPKDYLDRNQLEFLTAFYTDRLKDQHSVLPAVIDGIYALIEMKQLPSESVPRILNTFFAHSSCQSQQRGERAKLFKIFKFLSEHYEKELKQMSGDFIYGLINSIDGERDPRNLYFIFTFIPDLIRRFPLLHLSEEMFEVFACYFPIDFTPSREDANNISRDELADKLAYCLVASPEFLEWVVPLALEKLESDLVVAKLDSLELLRQSAHNFSVNSLSQHFDQIWAALKSEILPGSDNTDVVSAALNVLRTILEQARTVPEVSHSYQTTLLGIILPHLSDAHQRLYNPSIAIALTCVAGDPLFAGERILNTFLLKLNAKATVATSEADATLTAYNNEQRISVYSVITQLFKIASIHGSLEQLNQTICNEILTDVICLLRQNLDVSAAKQNVDLKLAALGVLNESVPLLSEPNRAILYKVFIQLITHESLELECTQQLELLGALHPIEVQCNCIDVLTRNFAAYTNFVKRKVFRHLLPLVPQPAFTARVLDLVWNYSFGPNVPNNVRLIALEALNSLLSSNDSRLIVELQSNNCLIAKLVDLALGPMTLGIPALEQISIALSHIEQEVPVSEQYMIVSEYLSQLKIQTPAHLYVTKGLLGRLHPDICLDEFIEWLLDDLIQQSLNTVGDNNEQLCGVARQLLCGLVNRIEENEENNTKLNKLLTLLKSKIEDEDAAAVETLAWLAKGLIVRGSEHAYAIIEPLTEQLDHPTLAIAATVAFKIIAADYAELFLPKVKFLYKQKLFNVVTARLGNKLEGHSEHHLIAFIYVLQSTPHLVQKMNIDKIGPLLFKSLECNHTTILCISLDICERFVSAQDEYFLRHLNHIIPSCLQLSKYQHSMKVRITALSLLHDITKYPTHVLLTHKVDVVLELASALDDPKRLVRNAAVRTRNSWFLVGTSSANE